MNTEIIYWEIIWNTDGTIANVCVASHSQRVDEGIYIYEDIKTNEVN